MWLILAEDTDQVAPWAATGLRRRGLHPVELVRSEQLGSAVRWEHSLNGGRPQIDISLADGRRILGERVRGTLNRLSMVPSAALAAVETADREYALGELFALYVSWLHALPGPKLNAPSPLGLAGRWRTAVEWTVLAARAGLPVSPVRFAYPEGATEALPRTTGTTVTVVGGQVVGQSLPESVATACVRLALLAETELLGVGLTQQGEGWVFLDATPWPDLRTGGEPLLDAIANVLSDKSETETVGVTDAVYRSGR